MPLSYGATPPRGLSSVLAAALGFMGGVAFTVVGYLVWGWLGETPRGPVTPLTQVHRPSPSPAIALASPSTPAPSPEASAQTGIVTVEETTVVSNDKPGTLHGGVNPAPGDAPPPASPEASERKGKASSRSRPGGAPPATTPPSLGPRVAAFMSQAEGAVAAGQYEAAANFFDQALELDPANTKARVGRTGALTIANALRRGFVPTPTTAESTKGAPGHIQGFDSGEVEVKKAPDVPAKVEFEISPAHVKPRDPYTVSIFLVNTGKKSIKLKAVSTTRTMNGALEIASPVVRSKEVGPRERTLVAAIQGTWPEDAATWSLEVAVTSQKGDAYKSTVVWR
jgi:hypothetical protein